MSYTNRKMQIIQLDKLDSQYARRQRLPKKGDVFQMYHGKKSIWRIGAQYKLHGDKFYRLHLHCNLHVILVYMQMFTKMAMCNHRIISLSIDHMNYFTELFSSWNLTACVLIQWRRWQRCRLFPWCIRKTEATAGGARILRFPNWPTSYINSRKTNVFTWNVRVVIHC